MKHGKMKKIVACALSFLFAALFFGALPVRSDEVVHIVLRKGKFFVEFENGLYSGGFLVEYSYTYTLDESRNFTGPVYNDEINIDTSEPYQPYSLDLTGVRLEPAVYVKVVVILVGNDYYELGSDEFSIKPAIVTPPSISINNPQVSNFNNVRFSWSVTPANTTTSYTLSTSTNPKVTEGKATTSFTYNLSVNVDYTLTVKAEYSDNGVTKVVSATLPYKIARPAGPTLALEDVSTSSQAQVKVSWSTASGVTYRVLRDGVDVSSRISNGSVDTDVTFGSTHTYSVCYILPVTGEFSNETAKTITLTKPAAPGKPTGLTAVEVTSTTVKLSWNAAANATSYRIYWDRGEGTPLQSIESSATAGTVTGLAPNTDYRFYVSALSAAVESEKSSPLTAKTKTATKPAKPTGLALVSAARDSLTVSWDSASDVTSWTVSYTREGKTLTVESTSAHAKLEGLEPDTEYSVTVTAQNASGKSDPSDPVVMKTKEESEDGEQELVIEFGDATDTVIPLRWNAVEGAVSYRVTRSKGVRDPFEEAAMTEATYWDDTELEPGTTYFYVVEALDEDGAVFLRSSPAVCDTLAKTPVILPDSGRQSVAGLSLKRLLPFYALFILLMMGLLFVLQMKRKRDER